MQKSNRYFLVLLFLITILASVGQITNTIYVPAMGQMADRFTVQATHIQTVMAVYLLMYGLSQFFYGPLSDIVGRRPTILWGLIVFCVGSLVASFANDLTVLLIGSIIQGLGIGVGGVMARTVVRDAYSGQELHRAASYISIALIVAPLLAPLLGGFLTASFDWRANFIFLLAFGFSVLIFQFLFFKETNIHVGKLETSFKKLLQDYKMILFNRNFFGYMVCLLVTFAGVSVFEASAGVIFSELLNLKPMEISVLFILPLPAYMLGSYLSAKMSYRFEVTNVIKLGTGILLLSSLIMFLIALTHLISVLLVLIPVSFYLLGGGLLFPAATAGALEPFPMRAGTAGALLGGLQNLGAGAFTSLSASIPQTSIIPLSSILLGLSLLVVLSYYFLLKPK